MEKMSINPHQQQQGNLYHSGDHDNPHEPPENKLEGCNISQSTLYSHHINILKDSDRCNKLHYIYQHFQDSEKMHQIDPDSETLTPDDDSLYPYVNNDIEYGLFEDIVDSYYLESQIKDDFQCDHDCYSQHKDPIIDDHSNTCTHEYHNIAQSIQDFSDSTQQNNLHSIEENASLFIDDNVTSCDFIIIDQHSVIENANDTNTPTHTETLLVIQTYSIMILTIKTHLHLQMSTQHCYNKNYKIHIGTCMTQ